MTSKRFVAMIVLSALCVGVACSSKQTKPGDERGIAVTAHGAAVVEYQDVLVTLKGLGRSKDRYEAGRIAGGALDPMTRAIKRLLPDARFEVRQPELRSTGSSFSMWQRAFLTLDDSRQTDSVLRAAFDACTDKRLCGWDVEFVPADGVAAITAARRYALREARKQASELARVAEVRVGAPVAIREVDARTPGRDRVAPQTFSEAGLSAYEQLLSARREQTPRPVQLVTLEVRFEIER